LSAAQKVTCKRVKETIDGLMMRRERGENDSAVDMARRHAC
jgi:hypothetical protein